MLIYGLMKLVEEAPSRYDWLMRLLTFNRIEKAHRLIALEAQPGSRVLDVGCGTGNVSILCAQFGAHVTSIDPSKQMLSIFRRKLSGRDYQDSIEIHECGAASMHVVLRDRKFDLIVACLVLGELPEEVRLRTLQIASEHLASDGKIVICEELWPENRFLSLLYHLLYAAFALPNFLLTRTMIRPVRKLKDLLEECELRIIGAKHLLIGTISILYLARA